MVAKCESFGVEQQTKAVVIYFVLTQVVVCVAEADFRYTSSSLMTKNCCDSSCSDLHTSKEFVSDNLHLLGLVGSYRGSLDLQLRSRSSDF